MPRRCRPRRPRRRWRCRTSPRAEPSCPTPSRTASRRRRSRTSCRWPARRSPCRRMTARRPAAPLRPTRSEHTAIVCSYARLSRVGVRVCVHSLTVRFAPTKRPLKPSEETASRLGTRSQAACPSARQRPGPGSNASSAPADGQVVDAVDEVRGEADDRPVELDPRQAAQELAEERVELEAGEVRAEALVRAMAEGEVAVRLAGDVEAERIGELALVVVRGHVVDDDLVPGGDPPAAYLDVARRGPPEAEHRRMP